MFDFLNAAFDRVMAPMLSWPAEWSCAALSGVVGVILLFCFKFVSMQHRIEVVKNRMTACILGVWLYRDQPGMIARCQAAVVWHGLHYLGLSLLPLVVFAIPMGAILGQMNAYYGYRPVEPGQSTLVTLTFDAARPFDRTDATLTPPPGARVDAVHRDPVARQITWRVACDREPGGTLQIAVDGRDLQAHLPIGDRLTRIQPECAVYGFWTRLLYPSEPPLPADGLVRSIQVAYPPQELTLLRWPCHWVWTCFAAMSLAILMLRQPMRVAI